MSYRMRSSQGQVSSQQEVAARNQEAEPVSEEFRGEDQGRKEQASCSMFADRGGTPCLFPIQRFRLAGAHPSERYDDAKLVASGSPISVRKTATASRKDTVSLRGQPKWWSLFGLGILCILSSSESIRIRIPVPSCTCLLPHPSPCKCVEP
jgi:hypothetical protein